MVDLFDLAEQRRKQKSLLDEIRATGQESHALKTVVDAQHAERLAPLQQQATELENQQAEIIRKKGEFHLLDLADGSGGFLDALNRGRRRSLDEKERSILFDAQRLQTAVGRIEQTRETALEKIGDNQQFLLDQLEFTEKGFAAEESFARLQISKSNLGIAQAEEVRKATVDKIKGADTEQLLDWLQNPENAPADLKNKRGLISMHLNDVLGKELNLTETRQRVNAGETRTQLDGMPFDQLEQIINQQSTLPPGLELGQVEQEHTRRLENRISLRSAAAAAQTGDIELEQLMKENVKTSMSAQEFNDAITAVSDSEDGLLEINGVTFSAQELIDGAANRQIAEDERNTALTTDLVQNAGSDALVLAAQQQAVGLQSILQPGVPVDAEQPYAGLGAQFQAELVAKERQYEVAKAVDNPSAAVVAARELNEVIQSIKKGVIDAAPKKAQGGYTEFVDTGKIRNVANASSVLMANASNPNAYMHQDVMSGPWSAFSTVLNEIRDQSQVSFTADDNGDLVFPTGKKIDDNVAIQQALEQSDFAAAYTVGMQQKLVIDAVSSFVSLDESNKEIWGDIYDPIMGEINQFAYENRGTPDEAFSLGRLSELLASKTIALREKGRIGEGQTLSGILLEKMKSMIVPSANEVFANDINLAALNSAAFNNQPHSVLLGSFAQLQNNAELAMQEAQATRERVMAREMVRAQTGESQISSPRVGAAFTPQSDERESLLSKFLGLGR